MPKRKPITTAEKRRSERLRIIWEAKKRVSGWTQDVLAEKLGYAGPSAVSQYLTGFIPLNMETAIKFARVLQCALSDIEPEWAGVGAMSGEQFDGRVESRAYPVISWIQALHWQENMFDFDPAEAEEWIPLPSRFGAGTFLLRVSGDAMTSPIGESYPEGSLVIVDPNLPAKPGDAVIANLDGSVNFKRLIVDGNMYYLKSLNPQYPVLPVTGELDVIGVVRGSIYLK